MKLISVERRVPWWRQGLSDPGPRSEVDIQLVLAKRFCFAEVSGLAAPPRDEDETWGGHLNIDAICLNERSLFSVYLEFAPEKRAQSLASIWLTFLTDTSATSFQFTIWRFVVSFAILQNRFMSIQFNQS